MQITSSARRVLGATALIAAAGLVAGCSTGSAADDEPAADSSELTTLETGILKIGSQQSYIPGEYIDEEDDQLKGFAFEIIETIAADLGLETEWIQSDYSALIAGLQAEQFDMSSGGMSPNPERLELVDMVGYFQSGSTFLLRAADEGVYTDAQSLCGHPVGLLAGSTTLQAAFERENAECEASGNDPIELVEYTATPLGQQDLLAERIDAYTPDPLQAAKIVEADPDLYAWTEGYNLTPYTTNFTFLKDTNPALLQAVFDGVAGLMESGEYLEILEKYDALPGALDEPAYNGEIGATP
ncbi:ABC transporter substrate-binding protein [Agromyces rhizosphaerae]|uniref:ABC transporter substrate-binding protein n=1 Tax=Agromyces rhizosphaerae TaxID=88374 RepID=A0A9W6FPJ9_9MICO|nr:transporter substrate-binding domain-containing protein [Agromyces rhizosphaerae]GLI27601.1 ABC transporter substrate-binding protein [Agromyces rhizosphaerae]